MSRGAASASSTAFFVISLNEMRCTVHVSGSDPYGEFSVGIVQS